MAKRKAEDVVVVKDTKKPSKGPGNGGRKVSVCIPSTVIGSKNAYNLEQITHITYQIAKACTIYDVVEIVVVDIPKVNEDETSKVVQMSSNKGGKKLKFNFKDEEIVGSSKVETQQDNEDSKDKDNGKDDNEEGLLLAGLLQFFITPPYLVKSLFSNQKTASILNKFKYAWKLPKITTLPFMSNNNIYRDFKEGLTIAKETPKITKKSKRVKNPHKLTVTKYVNIGESKPFELTNIKREIPVNSRVTVDLKNKTIVSPLQAYGIQGNKSSFGYYVRYVKKFNHLFTESSNAEGYSQSIFVHCDDYFSNGVKFESLNKVPALSESDNEGNVLIVVGNYKDYETSFLNDKENLEGVDNVGQMFDGRLQIPDGIKIEDGILIALTKLNL
ncbi:putative RNA methyltransferase [Scheffersomyces amazonensis]|uniref:putative RNA methyltransferase n=1 Tax=Scheffersomyces amazonensis TaxID=1078765 RepID=UPI00315D90E6